MPRYFDADKIELKGISVFDQNLEMLIPLSDVRKALQMTLTADVQEVRHGKWILLRESEITGFNPEFAGLDPIGGYQCSNCKEVAILDCNDEFVLSRYCPHCGAKMDRKE